jgi:hypothetical protein
VWKRMLRGVKWTSQRMQRGCAGFQRMIVVISPFRSLTPKKANKRRKLVQTPVSVEKSRFTEMLFVPAGLWLFASLVFSGQVHAVAICGVGLRLRNRTSRFRFCAVAAR